MFFLVMGVSGCGKSRVGKAIARHYGIPFHDADDYHTPANRERLQSNIPLTDLDRRPWLEDLARRIIEWDREGDFVLACSALKEIYRAILRESGVPMKIIYIQATEEIIKMRLENRRGRHDLIDDYSRILPMQFHDLEPPRDAIILELSVTGEGIEEMAIRELETRGLAPRPGNAKVAAPDRSE